MSEIVISDDTSLKRRDDLISAGDDVRTLVFDPVAGNCFELNQVGTWIWRLLASETSFADLIDQLQQATEGSVPRDKCRTDTLKLLSSLQQEGFLSCGLSREKLRPSPVEQRRPNPSADGVFDEPFRRLIECDSKQQQLTDEVVLVNLAELLGELEKLRATVDCAVERFWRRAPGNGALPQLPSRAPHAAFDTPLLAELVAERFGRQTDLRRYPIGFCRQITEVVYGMIVRNGAPFELLGRLRDFQRQGGIFQLVWGSIRDIYFQTAMQVGTQFVDVANDTVDPAKPPVESAPLARSGFKSFTSIAEYARVKRAYHGVEVYVNDLFPMWAPVCPLLEISADHERVRLDRCPRQIRWALSVGNRSFFDGLWNGEIPLLERPEVRARLLSPFQSGEENSKEGVQTHLERTLAMSRDDSLARESIGRKWVRFVHRAWARAGVDELPQVDGRNSALNSEAISR